MTSISEALAIGVEHHRGGRWREAEAAYRSILQADPQQPHALHLLGVLAHQVGRHAEAIDLIGRAIAIAPDVASMHCNLGAAYRAQGSLDDAMQSYQRALSLEPHAADVHNNIGNIHLQRKDWDQALAAYQRALELDPASIEPWNNLGAIHAERGDFPAAISCYRQALQRNPQLTEAHRNLARVFRRVHYYDEAVRHASEALRSSPAENSQLELEYANALSDAGRGDEAESAFRRLLEQGSHPFDAHRGLGNVYMQRGEFDRAAESFRHALAVEPNDAKSLCSLAILGRLSADEVDRCERLTAPDREAPPAELLFGLGTFLDRQGESDRAFECIERGNRATAARWDPDDHHAFVERVIATFSDEFLRTCALRGSDSTRGVFVVGMPRSGTTLVEQILGSHPDVYPAGESPAFRSVLAALAAAGTPYPEGVVAVDQPTCDSLIDLYLRRLCRDAGDARRVTDKVPGNFLNLGWIAVLFPQATIVHCVRHPLDVGLSNYFQIFENLPFSFDLAHIGRYYLDYRLLMEHWREVLPVKIHCVSYEQLVSDTETVARELVDACGLEWDDRCLESHRHGRSVDTASVWQVRQPVYHSSVGRWRNYRPQLAPLIDTLGDAAEL